jgi:Xaa-Pro aminopeptidase
MNTLVLKGHINNARLIIPDRVNGENCEVFVNQVVLATRLDSSARQALWADGYDFGHGVGHGVGHFLNVHEFPPSIGYRQVNAQNILRKGTIVTIEPGYYDPNHFGIRIENDYEMVEATGLESKATNFLAFRPLTWVPIQTSLIDKSLLIKEEVNSFNLNLFTLFLDQLAEWLSQDVPGEDRRLLEATGPK